MELSVSSSQLSFVHIPLLFQEGVFENVFAKKNNSTVAQTLSHQRYRKFEQKVVDNYSEFLNWELGKFLLHLKLSGDKFYASFLNKYGDGVFSHFIIQNDSYENLKGIYLYSHSGNLKYIGRCRDSFKKRINQGYGKIHPKNCFIDGQATNCHLNALITENRSGIEFFVCPLENNSEIEAIERELIAVHNPNWNIALRQD